jgi:hypothetical protein
MQWPRPLSASVARGSNCNKNRRASARRTYPNKVLFLDCLHQLVRLLRRNRNVGLRNPFSDRY